MNQNVVAFGVAFGWSRQHDCLEYDTSLVGPLSRNIVDYFTRLVDYAIRYIVSLKTAFN